MLELLNNSQVGRGFLYPIQPTGTQYIPSRYFGEKPSSNIMRKLRYFTDPLVRNIEYYGAPALTALKLSVPIATTAKLISDDWNKSRNHPSSAIVSAQQVAEWERLGEQRLQEEFEKAKDEEIRRYNIYLEKLKKEHKKQAREKRTREKRDDEAEYEPSEAPFEEYEPSETPFESRVVRNYDPVEPEDDTEVSVRDVTDEVFTLDEMERERSEAAEEALEKEKSRRTAEQAEIDAERANNKANVRAFLSEVVPVINSATKKNTPAGTIINDVNAKVVQIVDRIRAGESINDAVNSVKQTVSGAKTKEYLEIVRTMLTKPGVLSARYRDDEWVPYSLTSFIQEMNIKRKKH